jgi:hypothetical protein
LVDSPPDSNQEKTSNNPEQQENTSIVSNVALEVSPSLKSVEKIYSLSENGKLRQGEIITNLMQIKLNVNSLRAGELKGDAVVHTYTIVITQDCDCEQDFKCREKEIISDKLLPTILFCEIATAEQLKGNTTNLGSKFWKEIIQNKSERYHFLEKVPLEDDAQGEGLPELGLDFKRYFTIPTDEVYYRIETGEAKRRCRLISPYMEHLSARFSYFLHRIALPNDHASE